MSLQQGQRQIPHNSLDDITVMLDLSRFEQTQHENQNFVLQSTNHPRSKRFIARIPILLFQIRVRLRFLFPRLLQFHPREFLLLRLLPLREQITRYVEELTIRNCFLVILARTLHEFTQCVQTEYHIVVHFLLLYLYFHKSNETHTQLPFWPVLPTTPNKTWKIK